MEDLKALKSKIEKSLDAKLKAYGRADDAKDAKAMASHEASMHGIKHRAAGGAIEGGPARPRMDRGSGKKGKSKSKGTTVNVVIAPKDDKPPMPMLMPGGPVAGPPMPPKPPMPMPPPGGPPMPPPGAGPGGPPMTMRAAGGRLTAGAGSGEGRLEKVDIQKRKG